jgi:hypothetical protein
MTGFRLPAPSDAADLALVPTSGLDLPLDRRELGWLDPWRRPPGAEVAEPGEDAHGRSPQCGPAHPARPPSCAWIQTRTNPIDSHAARSLPASMTPGAYTSIEQS